MDVKEEKKEECYNTTNKPKAKITVRLDKRRMITSANAPKNGCPARSIDESRALDNSCRNYPALGEPVASLRCPRQNFEHCAENGVVPGCATRTRIRDWVLAPTQRSSVFERRQE